MKEYLFNSETNTTSWIYEYKMWTNPTIYFTLFKVFIICALVPALVVFCLIVNDGFVNALILLFKVFGIVLGIVSILLTVAYIIIACINGGKYIVVFDMNENGIRHTQMNKQFTKMQAFHLIGTLIGIKENDLVTAGSNMIAGSKNTIYTNFKKVTGIISNKKRNTIKLVSKDGINNQVYVNEEYYVDVLNRITCFCPKNVKVRGDNY